jgi:uncharacterized protein (DUF362 family)
VPSLVSITKCEKFHNYESVLASVKKLLDLTGGLETLVTPGDTVILKPNLVVAAKYETGIITNTLVMKALCRICQDYGARRIIIGEGSAIGQKTIKAFEESGLVAVAEEMGAELVDFKKSDRTPMPIPGGKVRHRMKVPKVLLEADVVINVPVMKNHDAFPATLGLKNMKGVIQESDKKRFHRYELGQQIVDMCKLVMPDLTIIDGTVGQEGMGPMLGTPANRGILISSRDTVAADTVAADVMGYDPSEIEYIRLAGEQGLGCNDLKKIRIEGLPLKQARSPFKRVIFDFNAYRAEGIYIQEAGACTGCRNTMVNLLTYLEDKEILKGYDIIFGQLAEPPEESERELVCIGACTRKYRDRGEWIPGCAPFHADIVDFFRNKKTKKQE